MMVGFSAGLLGNVMAALVLCCAVVAGYRWVRHRSHVIGIILATTILARIALGLALFWISYLRLPVIESLQAGGGFWELAVDARRYYYLAAHAVGSGFFGPDPLLPSPFFVWVLTLWMAIVGVSPIAALFLNVCIYVGFVVASVAAFRPVNRWRADLPCIALVAAYSFSPVIFVHSTQPLKDEVFNALLTTACFGVLALRRLLREMPTRRDYWCTAAAAGTFAVSTSGAASIRWYYGFMMWCGLAAVLGLLAIRGRTMPWARYLALSLAVLAVVWGGFWAGSGRYYYVAVQLVHPIQLSYVTQLARIGFLKSGGNSAIVAPLRDDPSKARFRYQDLLDAQRSFTGAVEQADAQQAYIESKVAAGFGSSATAIVPPPASVATAAAAPAPDPVLVFPDGAAPMEGRVTPVTTGEQIKTTAIVPPPASVATAAPAPDPVFVFSDGAAPMEGRVTPVTTGEQIRTVATGLAVIFVPVSLLHAVSNIHVQGGRGLLSLVDLDTLYLDATCVVVLALTWTRRRMIGDRLPLVIFGVILSGAAAVLLGYVVTNFGTLWRLRALVTVPLWMIALALSAPIHEQPDPGRAGESDAR